MAHHERRHVASGVKKCFSARRQRIKELGFGERDILAGFQVFEMRRSHNGNDADFRFRHLGEMRDLARPVHSHLDDEHFGRRRGREHRVGSAELIVEVALRRPCLEFGREHIPNKALGGCLSDRTRDSDNLRPQHLSPHVSYVGNSLSDIVDDKHGSAGLLCSETSIEPGIDRAQRGASTRFDGALDKIMPVNAFAFYRRINETGLYGARIPRKAKCRHGVIGRLHERARIADVNQTSNFEFHSSYL